MATVRYEIEIDADVFSQICDAFAASFNYRETVLNENGEEVPNPDSKIDFLRKQTAKYWSDIVMNHLRQEAWKQTEAQLQQVQIALSAQGV